MNKYSYCGPVVIFGVCVEGNWRAETVAQSEAKARCNLTYQFKKLTNREAWQKVTLPGKIQLIS